MLICMEALPESVDERARRCQICATFLSCAHSGDYQGMPSLSQDKPYGSSRLALVMTNHLHSYGGSEVLCLEVAETLAEMGFVVHIHCNLHDPGISPGHTGISVSDSDSFPDVFDYDFVWSQHTLIPISVAQHGLRASHGTRIVSAHLSPFDPFEMTGLRTALVLGAKVVANSNETAARLVSLGVESDRVHLFHNACPDRFWVSSPGRRSDPTSILWVSNHTPKEVGDAARILRRHGLRVRLIGRRGITKRVSPGDLSSSDAVIAIGKTVQYAIKAGVPVYCYDHFGGPGWITRKNCEAAEYYNYSGRCCRRKLSPVEVAEEILTGLKDASEEVMSIRDDLRERYSLERFLQFATQGKTASRYESESACRADERRVALDAASSSIIRRLYRAGRRRRSKDRIRSGIARLFGDE